jgi:dynein heavy chain
MYYDVVVTVEPKKAAVRAAQQRLADANAKKAEMDELVGRLNEALAVLQAQYQKAMDEKNAAEAEAARCARRLDSA